MERGVPRTESNPIEIVQQPTTPPSPTTGSKRSHSPSEHSPEGNKRAKISLEATACLASDEATTCLAPPPNPIASKIYTGGLEAALDSSTSLGTGDIFFMDGFRDRWCRCSTVKHPLFLIKSHQSHHRLFFLLVSTIAPNSTIST
jgi:E3 ubiquitin-protein ligase UBR7